MVRLERLMEVVSSDLMEYDEAGCPEFGVAHST